MQELAPNYKLSLIKVYLLTNIKKYINNTIMKMDNFVNNAANNVMVIVKKNSSYKSLYRIHDDIRLGVGEGDMKTTENYECEFKIGTRIIMSNTTYVLGPTKKHNNCNSLSQDIFDNHHCSSPQTEPTNPNIATMDEGTTYIICSEEDDKLGLPKIHKSCLKVVFERDTEILLRHGTVLHKEDGSCEFSLIGNALAKLF